MNKQIKEKVDLNEITHSVRASQAVLQYGVGAMVDFPDQTLVTSAPEYWNKSEKIYDDRFASALGVKYFMLPTNISYVRFPEWYFCPKCRKFQTIQNWITENEKNKDKGKSSKSKEAYMLGYMKCPKCKQELVVARIVTVCEKGHLDDFPWIQWVHAKAKKNICINPELIFKIGASGTEGLDGLIISCACGARATLKGAFDEECFEKLEKEGVSIRCRGYHPFKYTKEKCSCFPRTMQRGASSVYFPLIYSSLVIPPYADKWNTKIEQSNAYEKCETVIAEEEPEERISKIKEKLPKWVEEISLEIGAKKEVVEEILIRKWLNSVGEETDVVGEQYKKDEYLALTGKIISLPDCQSDFSREEMVIEDYHLPHIKSIVLIDKVRVVKALVGFSRINPITSKNDKGFVNVKEPQKGWYPAYEVRGEGIFIELNNNDINKWITDIPTVLERAKKINENYTESYIGRSYNRNITAKFIMLHTLSHLLIKQLSFECGYSVASLSERIYCSNNESGESMSGIFIYTACGDSEGTLGGLVRQGYADVFPQILKKAIADAKICSNDPVCILSQGQGRESLNLAACHACALLPETCCEEKNSFLDRELIIGTYDNPNIGFWSELQKNENN